LPHDTASVPHLLLAALLSAPVAGLPTRQASTCRHQPGSTRRRRASGLVSAVAAPWGAAHIASIKVLEEMHIPVDCIAGTKWRAGRRAYSSACPAPRWTVSSTSIDWQGVIQHAAGPALQR